DRHGAAFTFRRRDARYANPSVNLVRPGPLYFSGVYLGDDPDPNIRFQILRDITGRFGGDSN
ncbi:MAG: hypothetical protein WA756_04970, partial [Pseudolabrys sp.]